MNQACLVKTVNLDQRDQPVKEASKDHKVMQDHKARKVSEGKPAQQGHQERRDHVAKWDLKVNRALQVNPEPRVPPDREESLVYRVSKVCEASLVPQELRVSQEHAESLDRLDR